MGLTVFFCGYGGGSTALVSSVFDATTDGGRETSAIPKGACLPSWRGAGGRG